MKKIIAILIAIVSLNSCYNPTADEINQYKGCENVFVLNGTKTIPYLNNYIAIKDSTLINNQITLVSCDMRDSVINQKYLKIYYRNLTYGRYGWEYYVFYLTNDSNNIFLKISVNINMVNVNNVNIKKLNIGDSVYTIWTNKTLEKTKIIK